MADQIVVMRDGRIEQTGAPLELYDKPVSRFVAGFIGSPSMNFLPGTLQGSPGAWRVQLGAGEGVDLPNELRAESGRAVWLGVRPEHVRLTSEGGIGASVTVVEPTGADTFVSCEHHGQALSVLFRERQQFQPGSTIRLSPDPAQLHVFDATSGQRLDAAIAHSARS